MYVTSRLSHWHIGGIICEISEWSHCKRGCQDTFPRIKISPGNRHRVVSHQFSGAMNVSFRRVNQLHGSASLLKTTWTEIVTYFLAKMRMKIKSWVLRKVNTKCLMTVIRLKWTFKSSSHKNLAQSTTRMDHLQICLQLFHVDVCCCGYIPINETIMNHVQLEIHLPSMELTYPILGKWKSSSKLPS